MSELSGSSSKSTTTIGARTVPAMDRAPGWLGKASPDTGAVKRNRARNRTGAAERTFMNDRTAAMRA